MRSLTFASTAHPVGFFVVKVIACVVSNGPSANPRCLTDLGANPLKKLCTVFPKGLTTPLPATTTRFSCSSLLFEQILARDSSDVLWTRRFSLENRLIRNRGTGREEKIPTLAEQHRRKFSATVSVPA